MKIKARRGVCIGVDRHLQAGDLADLDAARVTFLVGIGAVEVVPETPVAAPVIEAAPAADDVDRQPTESDAKAPVGKSGKKEK